MQYYLCKRVSTVCRAKTHFAVRTKSLVQNRDISIKVFVLKKDIVPYPSERNHETFTCAIHIFSCCIRSKCIWCFLEYTLSTSFPKRRVKVICWNEYIYIVNREGFDLPLPLNTITIVRSYSSSGHDRWNRWARHCGLNCCTRYSTQTALAPLKKEEILNKDKFNKRKSCTWYWYMAPRPSVKPAGLRENRFKSLCDAQGGLEQTF